jgi:DegV family protein with EDD domain
VTALAVVTDSTSDLDAETAARFGIDVVPLFVQFGEERFRDGVDLTRDAFYGRLRAGAVLPSTSQPTAVMFEDAFRPFVDAGREIVCLTINAAVSGTINAATAAAQQFPGAPITVVDSTCVSGGLGLQAMLAAELARDGADAATVLAALARAREFGCGYVAIPDLSHVVRTGRMSRTQALIGGVVKIVPVLRLARGEMPVVARVRTFARARDFVVAAVADVVDAAPGARVAVMHADAPAAARVFADELRARITQPLHALDILEAGPAIATHSGPDAVGVFVLPG